MSLFGKQKEQANAGENPQKAEKKELKNKHFQYPDDACRFLNENSVELVDIVPFNSAHCVYYYEK